jgi:peroxiredoxin
MLAVGTAAPDLRWTLSGQDGSVAGERGHPLMLVFFASWCPHCQAEVATLNAVQSRFADQGLRTIGVSASPFAMDQRGPASLGDVELFVKQHNARYPHLFDSGLVGAQRYGVRGFPTMYLVGADGTIRYAQSGEVSEADLAQAVQGALATR